MAQLGQGLAEQFIGAVQIDGTLTVNTINEKTGDNGIVAESVTLKDGNIDLTAAAHSIGASLGANTLTIGGASSSIVIPGSIEVQGTTAYINTTNLQVEDKYVEINKGGTTAGAIGAGFSILGDSDAEVGYIRTGSADNSIFEFNAPGNAFVFTVDINATKTLTVGGALNIEGDSNINQDVTTDASPTFAGLTLSGLNTANGIVQTDGSGGLSTSTGLPNGTTATTQSQGDNSTKLATTAYTDAATERTVSTVQSITAAGGITKTHRYMKVQGDGGAIDITASPQIVAGTADMETLTLKGESDTNTLKLDDGAGLALKDGLSFTLGDNDVIEFLWADDDSVWVEKFRSSN